MHKKADKNRGDTSLKVIDPSKGMESIPLFAKRPVRTAKDAKKMLGKLIHGFQLGQISSDNAKTLTYMLISFVQIIRDTEFEHRLQTVEIVLKGKQ